MQGRNYRSNWILLFYARIVLDALAARTGGCDFGGCGVVEEGKRWREEGGEEVED